MRSNFINILNKCLEIYSKNEKTVNCKYVKEEIKPCFDELKSEIEGFCQNIIRHSYSLCVHFL